MGREAGAGNVISGNVLSGIRISAGAASNQVLGNFIGTNASGLSSLPNRGDGVDVSGASTNTIGGAEAGAGNVISGNGGDGVSLSVSAGSNLILGNFIGTNASGLYALPNSGNGVDLANVANNIIGGVFAGDHNVISGNLASGISFNTGAETATRFRVTSLAPTSLATHPWATPPAFRSMRPRTIRSAGRRSAPAM